MRIASCDVVWVSLDRSQSLRVRRLYAAVQIEYGKRALASKVSNSSAIILGSPNASRIHVLIYILPPFKVVVEHGLEARPKQHIDSVEKAVQHGYPSSLHDNRVRVGDLDHKQEPDTVTAGGEVVFEILDAQRHRPREDLVESIVRLPLCASS